MSYEYGIVCQVMERNQLRNMFFLFLSWIIIDFVALHGLIISQAMTTVWGCPASTRPCEYFTPLCGEGT